MTTTTTKIPYKILNTEVEWRDILTLKKRSQGGSRIMKPSREDPEELVLDHSQLQFLKGRMAHVLSVDGYVMTIPELQKVLTLQFNFFLRQSLSHAHQGRMRRM